MNLEHMISDLDDVINGYADNDSEIVIAARDLLKSQADRIKELEGLVEGHTIRGDENSLLAAQVTKWACDRTDFKPDEVRRFAKAAYPDSMAIFGYGIPTNGVQCPKCNGPARYLVNVETGTTLLCPKCPHAWTIDQKE